MLPTIYQALADVPKASWLQTLQDTMDEVVETISYGCIHIATPSLLKKVMALQLIHDLPKIGRQYLSTK
jgi:hypothetical protein